MKKRGQAASSAAVLIAIITGLIILYILFIPPAEREKLLEGTQISEEKAGAEAANITLFELESPKQFLPAGQKEFEISLPAINLYLLEEGSELKRLDSLYIKKSLIGEEKATVEFEILSLEDTKNILLNFLVESGKGRLKIDLNDHEIFNSEVKTGNIAPVQLKDFFKQGANVLEFSTSSPGILFWRTNDYSLKNIIITADIVKREAQESRNTFVLSSAEKENMEKARLRFYPDCNIAEVGKLEIWINDYNLYSAVPDCGMPVLPIEFLPDRLVTGENVLRFKTEGGRYLIDQIKITSDLKKIEPAFYYFQLTDNQYKEVRNDTANVTLYMEFPDDVELKQADIRVNNRLMRLDQTEMEYSKDISNIVENGNNAVKIEPDSALDVVEFKALLET